MHCTACVDAVKNSALVAWQADAQLRYDTRGYTVSLYTLHTHTLTHKPSHWFSIQCNISGISGLSAQVTAVDNVCHHCTTIQLTPIFYTIVNSNIVQQRLTFNRNLILSLRDCQLISIFKNHRKNRSFFADHCWTVFVK